MTSTASYHAILGVLAVIILTMPPAFALTQTQVEMFANNCSTASYLPDGSFTFAPAEEITPESREEGGFKYKLVSPTYPDNQVELDPDKATAIDLYSSLKKVNDDDSSSHIWHVIAAPRVNGWSFGGHWANSVKDLEKYTSNLISVFNKMKNLSSDKDEPVYRTIEAQDIPVAEKLSTKWISNFGKGIMQELVFKASTTIENENDQEDTYSITFYYVHKPDLRYIQDQGYRWLSTKNVDSPGVVFGFVLDAEGSCVGNTKVKVLDSVSATD